LGFFLFSCRSRRSLLHGMAGLIHHASQVAFHYNNWPSILLDGKQFILFLDQVVARLQLPQQTW
jgi:hypothetical protein